MEAMGNFKVHVVACSKEALSLAIQAGFLDFSKAESWNEDGEWFVLFWRKEEKDSNHKFPSRITADLCIPIISKWLVEHPPKEESPDIDGSCSPGFELMTHTGGWSYEMLRVRSVWAFHGK